jgi:hypothetical protein
MSYIDPYVVLLPHHSTNETDQYMVVHVSEWVHVALGEMDDYTWCTHHDSYSDAAAERDRLNQNPGQFPPVQPVQTLAAREKKPGVSLTRS